VPTAKQKNKKKKNISMNSEKRNWKKKNEMKMNWNTMMPLNQSRDFFFCYIISLKWLLQITLICKHDMNKLWNALKRNCFIKILPLKMSLIVTGRYDFRISKFFVNGVKIWIIWNDYFMYNNKVTTTWIQISCQNWNAFFSNASHQIMI